MTVSHSSTIQDQEGFFSFIGFGARMQPPLAAW